MIEGSKSSAAKTSGDSAQRPPSPTPCCMSWIQLREPANDAILRAVLEARAAAAVLTLRCLSPLPWSHAPLPRKLSLPFSPCIALPHCSLSCFGARMAGASCDCAAPSEHALYVTCSLSTNPTPPASSSWTASGRACRTAPSFSCFRRPSCCRLDACLAILAAMYAICSFS